MCVVLFTACRFIFQSRMIGMRACMPVCFLFWRAVDHPCTFFFCMTPASSSIAMELRVHRLDSIWPYPYNVHTCTKRIICRISIQFFFPFQSNWSIVYLILFQTKQSKTEKLFANSFFQTHIHTYTYMEGFGNVRNNYRLRQHRCCYGEEWMCVCVSVCVLCVRFLSVFVCPCSWSDRHECEIHGNCIWMHSQHNNDTMEMCKAKNIQTKWSVFVYFYLCTVWFKTENFSIIPYLRFE